MSRKTSAVSESREELWFTTFWVCLKLLTLDFYFLVVIIIYFEIWGIGKRGKLMKLFDSIEMAERAALAGKRPLWNSSAWAEAGAGGAQGVPRACCRHHTPAQEPGSSRSCPSSSSAPDFCHWTPLMLSLDGAGRMDLSFFTSPRSVLGLKQCLCLQPWQELLWQVPSASFVPRSPSAPWHWSIWLWLIPDKPQTYSWKQRHNSHLRSSSPLLSTKLLCSSNAGQFLQLSF